MQINLPDLIARYVLPKVDLRTLAQDEAKRRLRSALHSRLTDLIPQVEKKLAIDGRLRGGVDKERVRAACYWFFRFTLKSGELGDVVRDSLEGRVVPAVLARVEPGESDREMLETLVEEVLKVLF